MSIQNTLVTAPKASYNQTKYVTDGAHEHRHRLDTGGTYTDAVLHDFDTESILGTAKALTTRDDLTRGIMAALDVLPQALVGRRVSLRCPPRWPPTPVWRIAADAPS